jgi:hypothetical protein
LPSDQKNAKPIFQSAQSLYDVYRNLIDGRWELSASRWNPACPPGAATGYKLEQSLCFDFSITSNWQSGERGPEISQASQPFEATTQSLKYQDKPYQIYQVMLPEMNGHRIMVGFSVSMSWLNESLIPTYARESSYSAIRTASLIEASHLPDKGNSQGDVYASFQSILPFWRLHISADPLELEKTQANREIWFLGLSVVMFLMVLGLGLFLFVRVSGIFEHSSCARFVSGVSHEFKTPLSLIRLYSETLAEDEQSFLRKIAGIISALLRAKASA